MARSPVKFWQILRRRRINQRIDSAKTLIEGLVRFLRDVSESIDTEEIESEEGEKGTRSKIKMRYKGPPFNAIDVDISIEVDDT